MADSTTYTRMLLYKDTGDGNALKLLVSKTTVYLQPTNQIYPAGRLQLTETTPGSSGIYKRDNTPDGRYYLYIDDTLRGEYGAFWVGSDELPYLNGSDDATITGDYTFEGDIEVSGSNNLFTGSCKFNDPLIDPDDIQYIGQTPSFANTLVWRSWVEAQIAAIEVSTYQESVNNVRVIADGVVETGKVYTSPKNAALSFSSPGVNNQCHVEITGTGAISQYIIASAGTLRDYVNFSGKGKHIKLILSENSISKICRFTNLTIFLSAHDIITDREFGSMIFENCTIYAYKNTTFNNCLLINCIIIHASAYKSYFKGTTVAIGCYTNNEYDVSLLSGGQAIGCASGLVLTTPTDPVDIT